nr:DUF6466 family protein [Bifidobacterium choloepi]
MLVVAGLAAVNFSALSTYNQATATLESNLEAAASDSPDLDALSTSQAQVDLQYESAAAMDAVLLPQLKSSIAGNATVSAKLTALIAKAQADAASTDSSSATGADGSSSTSTSALTDEQKQQIEDLLKSNGKQSSGDSTQSDTATTSTQSTAKPW